MCIIYRYITQHYYGHKNAYMYSYNIFSLNSIKCNLNITREKIITENDSATINLFKNM